MNLSRNAWRPKGAIPVHFIKSGTWLDDLLLDDCPGMDLTVEMLGIGSMPGLMEFRPKSSCVVAGVEEAALLLERCGLYQEIFDSQFPGEREKKEGNV